VAYLVKFALDRYKVQWRINQGGQWYVSPGFQAEGTVMQKSSPLLTHNNAIAGFTSQSLGLCVLDRQFYCNKISSQNAPKLATLSSKIEKKSG